MANTQAQVDAATANIIAAQANLVRLTTVISALPVNINQIEVTFNQPITDQAAAEFTLQRGIENINIASVVWSEDGTKALVTSTLPNLNTTDATITYTLTISGLTEEPLVETVDFAPVTESSLVITSEQIDLVPNARLEFEVRNQYGADMGIPSTSVAAVAWNITQDKEQFLTPVPGESAFTFSSDFVATAIDQTAEVGDQIRVTLIYHDFTTQEILTVGEPTPAATAAAIELGTVQPLEGNTMIFEGDTGLVLPATITDQFGEPFVLSEFSASGSALTSFSIDGVTFTSSNPDVVNVGTISVDADGVITFDTADPGTAIIYAVADKTGDIATTTVVANEEPVLSEMAIAAPTDLIAANDAPFELSYVAQDQYGNVLDFATASDLFKGLTFTSSDQAVVTDDGIVLDDEGNLEVTLAGGAGDVTLTASNYIPDEDTTIEVGTVTFTVLDDAVLTSIVGVQDLTTNVSPDVTTSIGVDNLIVNDQYGREFTLTGNEGAFVSLSDTDALTLDTSVISADGTLTADITGTDVAGTATATIDLVADITDPTSAVIDSYTVDFTNVTNIVGYAIKDVDTLYGFPGNDATSDYAKVITVVGLDIDGNEVAVDQDDFTALTSSDPAVIGTDLATMSVFGFDAGSSTVSAWIGADEVASTVVTASIDLPQGQTVAFEDEEAVIAADANTVDLAPLLTVVDQYGVELSDPASLGIWSSSDTDVATVSAAGLVTAQTDTGGEVTISFVLDNGNASGSVLVIIEPAI
jgi:hypothetical protein